MACALESGAWWRQRIAQERGGVVAR
jgi:hypothetical protein